MKLLKSLFLVLVFGFTSLINAQTITSISPENINPVIGTEFEVVVSAENVVSLFGTSFNLEFDNYYIEAVSVTDEGFLGNDVVFFPNIDNVNGKVSVGLSRKFGQGSVSGAGDLVKIVYKLIALPSQNFTVNFSFSDVTANDDSGVPIALNPVSSTSTILLTLPAANKILLSSPQQLVGNIGSEFSVTVSGEDVVDLFGISFNLEFDKYYIEAVSVTDEGFLGNDVVFFPNIDTTNGKVSVGLSRKFGQVNVSGSGDLVKINFRVTGLPSSDYSMQFNISNLVANDEQGNTITLTAENSTTVLKLNQSPILMEIPDQTIEEGGEFSEINLDEYASDPDNGDSEISWSYSGNTELIIMISNQRILSISTPDENWNGIETITLLATDPGGLSDNTIVTFTVTPVNDSPEIMSSPITLANEDHLYQYQMIVEDVEGDTLFYKLIQSPVFLGISNNGLISGTPGNEDVGNHFIETEVSDGNGGTVSQTYTLTVVNDNDPPVLSEIPNQTINEGNEFQAVKLDQYVEDIDNSTEEIEWTWTGNSELAVTLSENRELDISIPDDDWNGVETILLTCSDPLGGSDSTSISFKVMPINDPPILELLPEIISFGSDSIYSISMWDYVIDVDNEMSSLVFEFAVSNDSLNVSYEESSGLLELSTLSGFWGTEFLYLAVTDDSLAFDTDTMAVVIEQPTTVEEICSNLPQTYSLSQNYPNPFNPSTSITYSIPEEQFVELKIHNIQGKEVAELVNSRQPAGAYKAEWDASGVSSGIYFYTLYAGEFRQTRKMLLLR